MKKFEILLAGVMAFSPALFAQQSTPQSNSQNSAASTTQTTQTETTKSTTSKSKLTADQKAELKDLRMKEKDACKTDKKSEACKTARQDLHAKMDEYGVKKHAHHMHKKSGSSTQSPS